MHTGSKGWRIQRLRVLRRDMFICRACGKFGDQVDHIHDDADQHVTDDRLQTLCQPCHSRKTAKTQGRASHDNRPKPV